MDRPSNKDIKHLRLQRGDLPAINMSYVFPELTKVVKMKHILPIPMLMNQIKVESGSNQANIFRAFAYTAAVFI